MKLSRESFKEYHYVGPVKICIHENASSETIDFCFHIPVFLSLAE